MSTLISKILNYEQEVFDKYLLKRKEMILRIKEIEINNLTNDQLLNFINDVKESIDPLKVSIDNIQFFIENKNFKDTTSFDTNKKLLHFLLFEYFYSGSESDNSLSSESVFDSYSDSESLLRPNSSRSVSDIFSKV